MNYSASKDNLSNRRKYWFVTSYFRNKLTEREVGNNTYLEIFMTLLTHMLEEIALLLALKFFLYSNSYHPSVINYSMAVNSMNCI